MQVLAEVNGNNQVFICYILKLACLGFVEMEKKKKNKQNILQTLISLS